jgi:hypothetical protein
MYVMTREDITNAYAFSLAHDVNTRSDVLAFMYQSALDKLDKINLALCSNCVYDGQQDIAPMCRGCGVEGGFYRNFKCKYNTN